MESSTLTIIALALLNLIQILIIMFLCYRIKRLRSRSFGDLSPINTSQGEDRYFEDRIEQINKKLSL